MEKSYRIAATLLYVFLAGLLSSDTGICVAQEVTGSEDGIVPYVLFSSYAFIYRMYPNGTGLQTLVRDPEGGIIAMDYHYSMDCVFWATTNIPSIKTARLNGSNITSLVNSRMRYPAGLAVDWINNKLYWTDRDLHHIEEYDLATSRRRVVLTTGAKSSPVGIEIHPYPGFGWLYWVDRMLHSMSRASVVGNTSAVVMRTNLECGWPLTIDHRSGKVFWSDYCTYRIETLDIDGSNYSVVVDSNVQHIVLFSYGIAKYGNMLYWTQPTKIYSLNLKPGSSTTMLYTGSSSQPLRTLHVVHPSQQPSAEDLSGNTVCVPPCENGRCINPGLCACNPGWTGLTCTTDVDECAQNNGGCEQICTNSKGSYSCSCNDGFVLGENNKNCETPQENPTFPATTAIIYESAAVGLLEMSSTPVVASSTPALTSSSAQTPKVSTHVQASIPTRTVHRLSLPSVSFSSSSSPANYGGPTLTTLYSAIPGIPSSSNAVLEPIGTPVLPTEGVMNQTPNGIGLLITLVSVIGASVIIVVGVLYATLLVYKYRRRKRSWAPRLYDISSSGSSFRGLTARSPVSTPSTGPSDASSRSSLTVHSRPPASISPVVIPTHSGADASETQSCQSFVLKWSD